MSPIPSILCVSFFLLRFRAVSDWHFLHNPPLLANLVAPKLPGVFICQPSDVLWMDACLQLLTFHICMRTPPLDSSAYVVPFLKQLLCVAYPPLFNSSRRRTTVSAQQGGGGVAKHLAGFAPSSRRSQGDEGEKDESHKRIMNTGDRHCDRVEDGDVTRKAQGKGQETNLCSSSLSSSSSSVLFAATAGETKGESPLYPIPVPVGAAITGVLVHWTSNPVTGRWGCSEVMSTSKSEGFEAHERQVAGGRNVFEVYVQRRQSAPPFTLPLLDLRRVKPLRLNWDRSSGCAPLTNQQNMKEASSTAALSSSTFLTERGEEREEMERGDGRMDRRVCSISKLLGGPGEAQRVALPKLKSGLWLLSGASPCLNMDCCLIFFSVY